MITSLRMVNFKNFADETLRLGPFTVIIGANASGKSNIRDAFRFLHGIGRGYTLAEIFGGKYGPGGQLEWLPIRGAPNEIVRFQKLYPHESSTLSINLDLKLREEKASFHIRVGLNPISGFEVLEEELKTESMVVYRATIDPGGSRLQAEIGDESGRRLTLPRDKPALQQILTLFEAEQHREYLCAATLSRGIGEVQFMELSPDLMREPSLPRASVLGDSGQNLPTVLEAISADVNRNKTLLSWLEELTPMDVKGFEFPRDPSGRVHLQIVERNGRKVSAYSASDGTLRFLGILAALLTQQPPSIYVFEDLDSGIHPARLWLLLDFIERQTAKGDVQVITTTHSPAVLTWMNDSTFEHTSVVYRDDYWSDSVIRPIAGLYNLRELRKSTTLGELFTSNWIGEAMKFSEGDPDTDHLDDAEDEDES